VRRSSRRFGLTNGLSGVSGLAVCLDDRLTGNETLNHKRLSALPTKPMATVAGGNCLDQFSLFRPHTLVSVLCHTVSLIVSSFAIAIKTAIKSACFPN
jgi:hypothetical protein